MVNPNVTLPSEIYHKLWTQISTLELKPGERLSEAGIARQFGCNRIPVREAIRLLVSEGALEVLPQRGSFVTKIDMEQVERSRYLREVLEAQVVLQGFDKGLLPPMIPYLRSLVGRQEQYLALHDFLRALELDNEFHRIFYSIDNKEFVLEHTGEYEIHYYRARLLSMELEPENVMIYQHRNIIDAIARGDRADLERSLIFHFTNVSHVLLNPELVTDEYRGYIKGESM